MGTSDGITVQANRRAISVKDLQWADVVMVMEDKHRKRLLADFPDIARFNPIHVLDIPDDYRFMDSELVNLVHTAAEPLIDAMRNN